MSTKNDNAWGRYLAAHNIELDGTQIHRINAGDLKQITGREPRLLAKFDNARQLSTPLRDAGYTILPIENGTYLLAPGNLFFSIASCPNRSTFAPITPFKLVTLGRNQGESQYIDFAFNAGLLNAFASVDPMFQTIRGRERSTKFDFAFGSSTVEVDGVQIEVDSGYESQDDIILIEAKVGPHTEFNIRQLYYPYRRFSTLFPTKRTRSIFMQYVVETSIYSLYEFEFPDVRNPLSMRLKACGEYKLVAALPKGYRDLVDSRRVVRRDLVPQANELSRVLELLEIVAAGTNTPNSVADHFIFDVRQSNYYREAAEYLGLMYSENGEYRVTDLGHEVLEAAVDQKRVVLARSVINSWIFADLIAYAKTNGSFDSDKIDAVIASTRTAAGVARYSGDTIRRRRQTIESWIRWLEREFKAFEFKDGKYYLA